MEKSKELYEKDEKKKTRGLQKTKKKWTDGMKKGNVGMESSSNLLIDLWRL